MQFLQFIFHNIIVHNKASADIRFLGVCCLKPKVAVHSQTAVIMFIACQPDGGIASFFAEYF